MLRVPLAQDWTPLSSYTGPSSQGALGVRLRLGWGRQVLSCETIPAAISIAPEGQGTGDHVFIKFVVDMNIHHASHL